MNLHRMLRPWFTRRLRQTKHNGDRVEVYAKMTLYLGSFPPEEVERVQKLFLEALREGKDWNPPKPQVVDPSAREKAKRQRAAGGSHFQSVKKAA